MNFSTFGPFVIDEWSTDGLEKFWADSDRIQEALGYSTGLRKAIGIYIVVVEDANGSLVPWYVGKTDNGFGIRFKQHRNATKVRSIFRIKSKAVKVFLIARITSSGKLKKVTPRMKASEGLKSIDKVEFALIGSCLAVNPKIINTREKIFHTLLHVPGYLNSDPKNYDEAALQLANMLKR